MAKYKEPLVYPGGTFVLTATLMSNPGGNFMRTDVLGAVIVTTLTIKGLQFLPASADEVSLVSERELQQLFPARISMMARSNGGAASLGLSKTWLLNPSEVSEGYSAIPRTCS